MNRRDAFRACAAMVLGAPIAAEAMVNYDPCDCCCSDAPPSDVVFSFATAGDPCDWEPECEVFPLIVGSKTKLFADGKEVTPSWYTFNEDGTVASCGWRSVPQPSGCLLT